MTTVPTASMPSADDRLDSKYMTRVMQSAGDMNAEKGENAQPDTNKAPMSAARAGSTRNKACSRTNTPGSMPNGG